MSEKTSSRNERPAPGSDMRRTLVQERAHGRLTSAPPDRANLKVWSPITGALAARCTNQAAETAANLLSALPRATAPAWPLPFERPANVHSAAEPDQDPRQGCLDGRLVRRHGRLAHRL